MTDKNIQHVMDVQQQQRDIAAAWIKVERYVKQTEEGPMWVIVEDGIVVEVFTLTGRMKRNGDQAKNYHIGVLNGKPSWGLKLHTYGFRKRLTYYFNTITKEQSVDSPL